MSILFDKLRGPIANVNLLVLSSIHICTYSHYITTHLMEHIFTITLNYKTGKFKK